MPVLCVECGAPVELGEYHHVLPTQPHDPRPRRMHIACKELAHHLAASGKPGELRRAWAEARRRGPDHLAQAKAHAIASRLLAFAGPRAASDWI